METLISVDESAFQVEWGNAKDLHKCGSGEMRRIYVSVEVHVSLQIRLCVPHPPCSIRNGRMTMNR